MGQKKFSSPRSELKLQSIEFVEPINKRISKAKTTDTTEKPKDKQTVARPEIKQKAKPNASDPYINGLIIAIHQRKNYPKIAKRLKQQGSVQLSFTIKKSGQISNIKIKKTSGYEQLDNNAITTVQSLETLSPLPDRFWPELNINIPIEYKLLGQ